MNVAEVTATLGTTVLGVAHVAADGAYRIGSAPGVNLPLVGLTDFPLVSGTRVRRPVGLGTLRVDGVVAEEARLVPGMLVTFELALVTIAIQLVPHAPIAVPKTRLDRKPALFVAGSLVAHLVLWTAAIVLADPPHEKKPRPRHVARPVLARIQVKPPQPPPPPPPTNASTHVASASVGSAHRRGGMHWTPGSKPLLDAAPKGGDAGFAQIMALTDGKWVKGMLDAADPLYDVDGQTYKFGSQEAFIPDERPGWGTIATGNFQTISSGAAAGDDYHLPGETWTPVAHRPEPPPDETLAQLALCESPRCELTGPLDKDALQAIIGPRGGSIYKCVKKGNLSFTFDIGPDGRVTKIVGKGEVARCVSNVIAKLSFPRAKEPTHADYTIGYP